MERLGRYELVKVLGEGGMGVVYQAVLTGPGGFRKPVALKVLKSQGEGLVREAKLGGLLRHPNLVEVFALERIDDRWVCAMELVPGGSLANREPLPRAAVIDIGLQVCAGLAHAHARIGLVHLDLKPSNLLLDGATVKIADFGIARARGFSSDPGIRGTPAYMSPEQAAGEGVDARSDLYSLGICLAELATGRRPNIATGPAETWSTVESPIPLPVARAVVQEIPWLAEVIARCLAPDPSDRIPSAEALAASLGALDPSGPGLAEALGLQRTTGGARVSTGSLHSVSSGTRLEPTQSNLSVAVDSFVGRDADLEQLDGEVRAGALVTLKGLGGSGKTRLALQFADRWRRTRRGQTWFVDLAAARGRTDVVRAVSDALAVPLGGGSERDQVLQIQHALAGRGAVLLVLDNLEQLVDCEGLVAAWSQAGPEVRVLATSREPLHLEGERVHEVGPLAPADAVDLLIERSRAAGRDVRDDPAIPELARRLDGLPLALELAAARAALLSPSQILARLDRRLQLLGSGSGGRHATLRASLDGSWEILDDDQRSALAQLSVFRGGFELEAAERVLALRSGAPWVLDLLAGLVDRSLVVRRRGLRHRFDLLESVRDYAAEKLEDREEVERRHGLAFAALGDGDVLRASTGPGGFLGWERLSLEFDNLVIAHRRAIARGDSEVAVTTGAGVLEVLDARGPYQAALGVLEDLDRLELDADQQGRTHQLAGRVLRRVGRMAEAAARLRAAAELFEALSDPRSEADALNHLGNLERVSGRGREALALLQRAEALYQVAGDPRGVAVVWGNRAACHFVLGELEEARGLYERALLNRRMMGDRRGEGHLVSSLAVVSQVAGRVGEAHRYYTSALQLQRESGDRRGEALTLANLGVLASDRGDLEEGERLWDRAMTLRRELGDRAGEGILLGYLSLLRTDRGDLVGAAEAAQAALVIQRDLGARRHVANLLGALGGIAVVEGRLEAARELLEQARTGQVEVGDRVALGISLVWWGRMCRAQGKSEDAWTAFDAAVDAIGTRHLPSHAMALAWRGWAWHARGQTERGQADLEAANNLLRSSGIERGHGDVLILRALVQGDPTLLDDPQLGEHAPGGPTGRLLAEVRAQLGVT